MNSHILGVILANQYNLKKGKEVFGKRADAAVINELSEIDVQKHVNCRESKISLPKTRNGYLNSSYLFLREGMIMMVTKQSRADM